ncbi:hypothetical protein ACTXT7_016936, partial [Hymenolepis weldensis]
MIDLLVPSHPTFISKDPTLTARFYYSSTPHSNFCPSTSTVAGFQDEDDERGGGRGSGGGGGCYFR